MLGGNEMKKPTGESVRLCCYFAINILTNAHSVLSGRWHQRYVDHCPDNSTHIIKFNETDDVGKFLFEVNARRTWTLRYEKTWQSIESPDTQRVFQSAVEFRSSSGRSLGQTCPRDTGRSNCTAQLARQLDAEFLQSLLNRTQVYIPQDCLIFLARYHLCCCDDGGAVNVSLWVRLQNEYEPEFPKENDTVEYPLAQLTTGFVVYDLLSQVTPSLVSADILNQECIKGRPKPLGVIKDNGSLSVTLQRNLTCEDFNDYTLRSDLHLTVDADKYIELYSGSVYKFILQIKLSDRETSCATPAAPPAASENSASSSSASTTSTSANGGNLKPSKSSDVLPRTGKVRTSKTNTHKFNFLLGVGVPGILALLCALVIAAVYVGRIWPVERKQRPPKLDVLPT